MKTVGPIIALWLTSIWVGNSFGLDDAQFNGLSGQQKFNFILSQIKETEYSPDTLPGINSILDVFETGLDFDIVVRPTKLAETATSNSVELPADRAGIKEFHKFGTMAGGEFIAADDSEYTGLFKGAQIFLRFSYAGRPRLIGNVPGLGLFFMVDGRPMERTVAMHSLDPQGPSTDVFFNEFSNIIPEPKKQNLIMQKIYGHFQNISIPGKALTQAVDNLAMVDRKGGVVPADKAVYPEQIWFVPTKDHTAAEASRKDFRAELRDGTPSNTEIYKVWASRKLGEARKLIGRIVTSTPFYAAAYGDSKLFCKHSDKYIKPEFKPSK